MRCNRSNRNSIFLSWKARKHFIFSNKKIYVCSFMQTLCKVLTFYSSFNFIKDIIIQCSSSFCNCNVNFEDCFLRAIKKKKNSRCIEIVWHMKVQQVSHHFPFVWSKAFAYIRGRCHNLKVKKLDIFGVGYATSAPVHICFPSFAQF